MTALQVDGLAFTFPREWTVAKYDDWSYYRRQFRKMWDGIKAVDLVAIDPHGTAWLIEAKNYRQHRRENPSGLQNDVARKVVDTLAGVMGARHQSNDDDEKTIAASICGAATLRVVLHLEQPLKHSKLFPRAIDPADVQQKLRKLLKPIDARPMVVESSRMQNLSWTVA